MASVLEDTKQTHLAYVILETYETTITTIKIESWPALRSIEFNDTLTWLILVAHAVASGLTHVYTLKPV